MTNEQVTNVIKAIADRLTVGDIGLILDSKIQVEKMLIDGNIKSHINRELDLYTVVSNCVDRMRDVDRNNIQLIMQKNQ